MVEAEFLTVADAAARAAGQVLEDWAEKFTVCEKGPADLVTEADVAAQKVIHEQLVDRFPTHGFLGEESLTHAGTSEYRWIIDPLDGTSNYVHRFPFYAVSIGLEKAGELILGVVYDPNRDEMFHGLRGQGAFANGKRLCVTKRTRVADSLLIASFPPGATAEHAAIRRFLKVLPVAQSVQRSGSAAMNLAYVAAGRLDGFWSQSLKPWDMAAGVLLVTEAGGRVTRADGGPFDVNKPDLLATNGTVMHDELAGLLSGHEVDAPAGP